MARIRFIRCIRADLQRVSDNPIPATGVRLWIRVLHPRCFPVILLRLASLCYRTNILRPISFGLSMINIVLFGLEVTPRCQIGEGLFLPHTSGTVLGATEIGRNATIFQGVTLGAKLADLAFDPSARPILGDNVIIGAGAKILGGIRIGSGAIIAANSLVIRDVRENTLVMGVPAIERPLLE